MKCLGAWVLRERRKIAGLYSGMSVAVVLPLCAVISSIEGSVRGKRACDTQLASSLVTAT